MWIISIVNIKRYISKKVLKSRLHGYTVTKFQASNLILKNNSRLYVDDYYSIF